MTHCTHCGKLTDDLNCSVKQPGHSCPVECVRSEWISVKERLPPNGKKAVDGKYYCASHLTGTIRDKQNLEGERCL